MMYGKIEDGIFIEAPNPMIIHIPEIGDFLTANPTDQMYADAGYLPVELAQEPAEPGKIAVPDYEIVGDKIVQSWRLEPAPPTAEEKIAALLAAIEGGIKDA